MTRAISWAAVSSKPQTEGESLTDQHHLNHALAEALGWDIVADITVLGESRSYQTLSDALANVDAYKALQQAVESHAVDWIIVKSRDRLGRTRRLNDEVANYLEDHGVRVYSRAIPPASTSNRTESDVWGEAIESGYSEVEVMRLRQRHAMGMLARVKKGHIPNLLPWGFVYVADNGREPRVTFHNPVAEATIRYIVSAYQSGLSKRSILRGCHERGYHTPRGYPWTGPNLDRIIFQPAYYGLVAWARLKYYHEDGRQRRRRVPLDEWDLHRATFDGLFAPEAWSATMAEYHRRQAEHPRRRSTIYPLSGIAWCATCDLPMVGCGSPSYTYYRCSSWAGWLDDRAVQRKPHYVRAEHLHRQLGEWLARLADDPALLDAALAEARETEPIVPDDRGALEAEWEDLQKRRTRWQDAYEAGLMDLAQFGERVRGLGEREEAVSRRLGTLAALAERAQHQQDHEAEVRQALRELPTMLAGDLFLEACEQFRAVLSQVLARITVRDRCIVDVSFRHSDG